MCVPPQWYWERGLSLWEVSEQRLTVGNKPSSSEGKMAADRQGRSSEKHIHPLRRVCKTGKAIHLEASSSLAL